MARTGADEIILRPKGPDGTTTSFRLSITIMITAATRAAIRILLPATTSQVRRPRQSNWARVR
jgi:hypothetical protein